MHEVLATTFRTDLVAGRELDVDRLTRATVQLAERQLAFSASARYREDGQTKRAAGDAYCALLEHEFGRPLPTDPIGQIEKIARSSFARLAALTAVVTMLASGSAFESEVSLAARFNGLRVSATMDLTFSTPLGTRPIIDWKLAASETSDYALQLLTYAWIAVNSGRWPGLTFDAIDLYEVNLLRGTVRSVDITDESISEVEDFLFRGTSQAADLAALGNEDFAALSLATSPNTCAYCPFARLCIEDLQASGRAPEAAAVQGQLWA